MIKRFILVGLGLLVMAMAWSGSAEDHYLFFEDLEVGMEGIGKTIIRSNEIRTFQARIVALVDSPGVLNDFIEIRVSGDAIREAGGVASGMSGSPIYVDGKLIGALSRAIAFDSAPSPFALVTPIDPMLALMGPARDLALDNQAQASVIQVNPALVGDQALQGYSELALVDKLPSQAFRLEHPDRLYATPIATPVMVSGMNDRAFSWFRSGIPDHERTALAPLLSGIDGGAFLRSLELGMEDRFPIQMMNTGLSGRQAMPAGSARGVDDLVPGGAVGVTLADGDVSIGAIGTVTYREGDMMLAFGHSFLFTGNANYFLTRAYIYDTVANLQIPFKFGTTTERVGALLQDRFQGIAGLIGDKPRSARMNVRMTDGQTGEVFHYSVDLVQENNFLPSMVFSAGLSLVDRTLNRVGKGTLTIDYTIRGAGLPHRVERTDIFTSHNDIAVAGPLQVAQVVFILAQNEFQDPKLDTIDMDITFNPEVRSARLVSVETDQESYLPGDVVGFTTTFMPFRGETFTQSGEVRIPDDVSSSRLTLHVFGGPRPSGNNGDSSTAPAFTDLEQIIDVVESLSRNDELTAELLGIPADDLDESGAPSDHQQINGWVITGEERVQLTIEQQPETPDTSTDGPEGEGTAPETGEEGETDAGTDEGADGEAEQSCAQLFFC